MILVLQSRVLFIAGPGAVPVMSSIRSHAFVFVAVFGTVLASGAAARRARDGTHVAAASNQGTAVTDWREGLSGGISSGPAEANAQMIVFSDYQCPACRMLHRSLERVLGADSATVRVVTHQLPLEKLHPRARAAARSALCAARQGRFREMERLLYDSQEFLPTADLDSLAGRIGLPRLAAFQGCMRDPEIDDEIDRDVALATRFGLFVTPSFIIAGRRYAGAFPDSVLAALLRISRTNPSPVQ